MIKKLWQNFVTSGIREKDDFPIAVNFMVVNIFSLAACAFIMIFLIWHLIMPNILIGSIEFLFIFTGILNLVLLRIHKNVKISSSVVLIFMSVG